MLQRLANMNANKPFLTQRNTEALAHDQTFPHLDANIAVAVALKCKALRAGQFWKKPCLVGSKGLPHFHLLHCVQQLGFQTTVATYVRPVHPC